MESETNQCIRPLVNEGRRAANQSPAESRTWVPEIPDNAPPKPVHSLGEPSAVWTYKTPAGLDSFYVLRWNTPHGKEIRPLTLWEDRNGKLIWQWRHPPEPKPVYGLDRLAERPDAPVLVVEGEKTADAAQELFPDLVIVTSSGGSKAAGKADWTPLAARSVVIWPDNDHAGRRYAEDVTRLSLKAGAASVRLVV